MVFTVVKIQVKVFCVLKPYNMVRHQCFRGPLKINIILNNTGHHNPDDLDMHSLILFIIPNTFPHTIVIINKWGLPALKQV